MQAILLKLYIHKTINNYIINIRECLKAPLYTIIKNFNLKCNLINFETG